MRMLSSLYGRVSLVFGDTLKPNLLGPREYKVSTIFGIIYASGLITAFSDL